MNTNNVLYILKDAKNADGK